MYFFTETAADPRLFAWNRLVVEYKVPVYGATVHCHFEVILSGVRLQRMLGVCVARSFVWSPPQQGRLAVVLFWSAAQCRHCLTFRITANRSFQSQFMYY